MPSNIYQPRPSTIPLNARSGHQGMDQGVYVNTNESLQVSITSSIGSNVPPSSGLTGVSVNIDIRMLTVNDGLQYLNFTFNPANTSTTETFQIKLPEGFLLNISAYTTGAVSQQPYSLVVDPLLGQTWVNLSIVAPVQPNRYMATYLTQGYVTNRERIAYPPHQTISYHDGYPFVRSASFVVPIGLIYQVPQNSINEITCVLFSVTTDATVSQRQVYLSFVTNVLGSAVPKNVIIPFDAQQGASSTVNYQTWIGGTNQTFGTSAGQLGTFAPLPFRLRLKALDYLQPGVSGAGPGDNLSNFYVWGNEWLVP